MPSLFFDSVCGVLSWFILAVVFEDLYNFSLFLKNLTPVRGLLCYIVAYRGLCTRVSLLHSRVQYAGCSCTHSHTSLSNKNFGLGFACPCPSVDFVLLSGI